MMAFTIKPNLLTISHFGALYGANKSLLTLILALKNEINWIVICKQEGDFTSELRKNNIRYMVIPFAVDIHLGDSLTVPQIIKISCKAFLNLILAPYLIFVILRFNPVAIHSNSSIFCFGAIIAFLSRIPHIWHIREFPEIHYNLYYDFGQRWFRFWANRANRIICVSSSLLKVRLHRNRISAKSMVIYNGIDAIENTDRSHPVCSPFRLLMVGLIHPSKEQLSAIKAVKVLNNAGFPVTLKIVGGYEPLDPYFKQMNEYIRSNELESLVSFEGYVSSQQEIYKEGHITLMCSKSEGMGRVTVESMLRGIPVIAFDSGGSSEIITHGKDGILYKGDHRSLALEIRQLLENKKKYQLISGEAKRSAQTRFTVQQYKNQFFSILSDDLAN